MATDRRSDPGRIKTDASDVQRDLAAKGGPAVGLGDAQNRQVPSPVEADLQTQATSGNKKPEKDDQPSAESQTKNRSGNRTPGSNH